jgi:hypothetical protein
MIIRTVSRLTLLVVALAAATALVVGGLSLLATAAPAGAATLVERDQAAEVERAVEAPAGEAAGAARPPVVVLIFAGIVLLAAVQPIYRVPVYHGPRHHHPHWL